MLQRPAFLAVLVAIAALSGAAEAAKLDPDGLVPEGCNATIAARIADSDDYDDCSKQSGFTFDVSLSSTTDEDDFCTSVECLSVFRSMKKAKVLECGVVEGLEKVPLTVRTGQIACFGVQAVDKNSNVIIRPPKGSGSGSSGSGSQTPEPTTTQPTATPTTDTPEPTTPKPTKTKPGSDSGSGSVTIDPISTLAPDASTSSGMDTTTIVTIIGICVGVLAVLAALWCAAARTKKKKKKNRRSKHMRPTEADYYGGSDHQPTAAQYYASASPTLRSSQQYGGSRGTASHMTWQTGAAGVSSAFAGWDEELIAAVRVPYEKLSFDQLISRGGYGEVYRGTYRGQVVAIKTLLPERRRDMRQIQSFLAEVKMMAAMEHDRIVRLIGVAWDSLEELSVVTEFLERGDLRTVLNEFETREHRPHGFDVDKIRIAMHVAHALTYLHSLQPVVLHRDLKSRNILLDAKLNAKLADFGVSRERADRTMTAGVGSSLWMAPEVMIGERYDEKADVFSFGVVLSELDQHLLPYSHAVEPGTGRKLPDPVVLQMVSLGRIRVAFTDEEQSEMAQVALQCVALNPADRPTAAQALHLIHQAWKRC